MRDPATIARILDSLEPRLRETQIGADAPPELLRRLLDETAGAVRAAAGELRAAGEERAAERATARGAVPQPAPETLGLLFASCPDALLLTDDAGTIVHANPASGALLGVRREDLAGLRVESFAAEDARAAVRDVLGMVRGSIEPRRIVLDLRPRRRLPIRIEACGAIAARC